jgi:hypothetical protein
MQKHLHNEIEKLPQFDQAFVERVNDYEGTRQIRIMENVMKDILQRKPCVRIFGKCFTRTIVFLPYVTHEAWLLVQE